MYKAVEYNTWKCRDGRELRITEMSDIHVVNAIRLCERVAEYRYAHQDVGAVDILEMCVMPIDLFYPDGYSALVREAQKRGIKL